MKFAIYLTNPDIGEFSFTEEHARYLVERLPVASLSVCATEAEFLDALEDANVALVWRFEQAWFARASRLKLISTPAAGRDYFQITPPPTVRVIYGSFHGLIMGETAVAWVLGAARGVLASAREMRVEGGDERPDKHWPRASFSGQMKLLRDAHVVILGFGTIGHHIARLLKPFGCRITGVRRRPEGDCPTEFDERDAVLSIDSLDAVLPTADHLICVLPSGKATTHLLDARRLRLLPRTAYLYNLGRGNVIDESALVTVLEAGHLAGVFLDVFEQEPLDSAHPLRGAPRAYLYPHVSAVAPQYLRFYLDELVPQLQQQTEQDA